MNIDLSRFKVIHGGRVIKALALMEVIYADSVDWDDTYKKPRFIEVLVINEDGNIEAIRDEAWRFQFIPNLGN